MPGDKPCRLDVRPVEELQESFNADGTGEVAPADIAGGIFSFVGTEPTCDLLGSGYSQGMVRE